MIGLNALIFVGVDAAAPARKGEKRKYEPGDTWLTVIGSGSTEEEREEFAAENPGWMKKNLQAMRDMQEGNSRRRRWTGYVIERDPIDLKQETAEPLPLTSDDEDQPASSRPSRRKGRSSKKF
jgi:predicted metal-dependent hydrolase